MLDWSNCGQVHAVHIVSLWMGNRKRYVDNCYVADFMAVCGDPLEGLGSVFLVWPSLTLRLHQGMLLKVLSGRRDIRNFSLKNVNKFGKESSDFFQGSCREEILGLEHHILRLYYFYLY